MLGAARAHAIKLKDRRTSTVFRVNLAYVMLETAELHIKGAKRGKEERK
jgi:hypothetical protein